MGYRKSGRTTRLVDDAIQDLFHLGEAHVWDHYREGKDGMANRRLVDIIRGRLIMEHSIKAPDINCVTTKLGTIIKIKNNDSRF